MDSQDSTDDGSDWPVDKLTTLRLGRKLVTEVPASRPGRRAFVDISPIRDRSDDRARDEGWVREDRGRRFRPRRPDMPEGGTTGRPGGAAFLVVRAPVRARCVSGQCASDSCAAGAAFSPSAAPAGAAGPAPRSGTSLTNQAAAKPSTAMAAPSRNAECVPAATACW